jgi:tetratricopeptide (TPR) repeat protein
VNCVLLNLTPKTRRSVTLVIIFACITYPALAQWRTGQAVLRGELVTEGGSLEGLTIEVAGQSNFYAHRVFLDRGGSFEVAHLTAGSYEVRVLNRRGEIIRTEYASVFENGPPITIRLSNSAAGDRPTGETVSVAQLRHKVPRKAAKEYRKAAELMEEGKIAESIKRLKKAIEIDPEYMEAYNDLGTRYMALKQHQTALECFQKAMTLDPHAGPPATNAAVALFAMDRVSEAEDAARLGVRNDRGNVKARYVLGLALVAQNKVTEEAIHNLEVAGEQFPNARLALAKALVSQGE